MEVREHRRAVRSGVIRRFLDRLRAVRARVLVIAFAVAFGFVAAACSDPTSLSPQDGANGNDSASASNQDADITGGIDADAGTGGSVGTGGSPGTGGSVGDAGGAPGDAGVPADGGSHPATNPALTAGDMPFSNPAWVSGRWVGYFENFQFPSGSDRLELLFGTNATGGTTLVVTLGKATAPPAPTDPTAAWPNAPGPNDEILFLVEGFSYPAHEVRWDGARLRFKLDAAEAWTAWCGLQTSYPVPGSTTEYNCLPSSGGGVSEPGPDGNPIHCMVEDQNGQHPQEVPCGQFALCNSFHCACDATGCGPATAHDTPFDMTFEMTLSGNTASGSADVSDLRNLHLMPAP